MGKQDRIHSDFFDNARRFADAFNGCLFQGKQVIRPQDLEEADSVFGFSTKQKPSGSVICDKVKKWKGVYFSIVILENLTYIDYFMVLRTMKEEVAAYDKQRRIGYEKEAESGRKPDKNEFLSKMFQDQL